MAPAVDHAVRLLIRYLGRFSDGARRLIIARLMVEFVRPDEEGE